MCNYTIYNVKLLVVIKYLKYFNTGLELAINFVVTINYKSLKYFYKTKLLIKKIYLLNSNVKLV